MTALFCIYSVRYIRYAKLTYAYNTYMHVSKITYTPDIRLSLAMYTHVYVARQKLATQRLLINR